MPLRKCGSCGGNLPAGATARARFCSATCRKRANRSKDEAPNLTLVTRPEDPEPDAQSIGTQIQELEASLAIVKRLLKEADPRSGAQLHKEYRDSLRELVALRAQAREDSGARTSGSRRPFDASAI